MVMASRDRSAKANRDLRWTTESCAQGEASGFGHQLPVAVTSKFLVPGGIEWLVFGDQIYRENFRTRP